MYESQLFGVMEKRQVVPSTVATLLQTGWGSFDSIGTKRAKLTVRVNRATLKEMLLKDRWIQIRGSILIFFWV